MDSEPRDECKRCFGLMQNANGTPVCIWCDYDREPPPTPAAAPHAAPREGEPEWMAQITEDVSVALSDMQRESRAVGETGYRPGRGMAERAAREAREEAEREILAAIASAYRQGVASQQAALDAAREETRRLTSASALEMRRSGGHARAASLSPERRSEIARAAATARWHRAARASHPEETACRHVYAWQDGTCIRCGDGPASPQEAE